MTGLLKYETRAKKINSLVCVGLDSDMNLIPKKFSKLAQPQLEFNKWIIDQTQEHAAAYKLNTAFYESRGSEGWRELELTVEYLNQNYPDIFLICDAKRNEIGNSMEQYALALLDRMNFDACTVNPYLGAEALEPFLSRKDKVVIVLCRTSNSGAREFQDIISEDGLPLWQKIAKSVQDSWNRNDNCMLVIGGTYPEDVGLARKTAPEITFLVPGIGKQGGNVQEVVSQGLNPEGLGLIINSSRGIIFSEDPGLEAKKLKDSINAYRL